MLKWTLKVERWTATGGEKAGPWCLLLVAGKKCLVDVYWYLQKKLK